MKNKKILGIILVIILMFNFELIGTINNIFSVKACAWGEMFGNPVEDIPTTISCGYYGYEGHTGFDLDVPSGTPLYSMFSGNAKFVQAYVEGTKKSGSYGNYIVITSDDGKYTAKYCHLSGFYGYTLNPEIDSCQNYPSRARDNEIIYDDRGGKHVNAGELVGYSGSTGNSKGPHCHVELLIDNKHVDPADYISNSYSAKKNIRWDVNNDGTVNILDVTLTRKYIINGLSDPVFSQVTFDTAQADVNEDGSIDILDVILLRKIILGTPVVAGMSIGNLPLASSSAISVLGFDDIEVTTGETIEMPLKLIGNPGIAGITVSLKYDTSVLKLIDVTNGDLISPLTYGNDILLWDRIENINNDGILATCKFSIADDVVSGNYEVETIVSKCVDKDSKDVELYGRKSVVSIDNPNEGAVFTIKYDANGGSGAPVSQTKYYNTVLTLSSTKPILSGYTFLGWAKSSTATSAEYQPGATFSVNANTTLYAVWKKSDTEKPTALISSTNNVADSQTATLSLSDNVGIAGYYWGTNSIYTNNTYTSITDTVTGKTVDKTITDSGTYYLTVKDTSGNVSNSYSIVFYKISLNSNCGTVSPTSIIIKEGNSILLPTPTKAGYTLNGWYSSETGGTKVGNGGDSYTPTSSIKLYAHWTESINPSVALSASSKTMTVGNTTTLTATTTPAGQTVTWTSSNTDVATVSNGTITAKEAGKTTITAKFTYNGTEYSAKCTVTVETKWVIIPSLSYITVLTMPDKTTYYVGDTLDTTGLTIKLSYSDGSTTIIFDGFTTSGFSSETTGTKTVTVTYQRKTTTFTVTVKSAVCSHKNTEIRNAKAATCGTAGYTGDTYCLGCGAKIASGTEISATQIHSWNSGSITKVATCNTKGEKTITCTVCGVGISSIIAIDRNNHTGGTEIKNAVSATCETAGYTGDTYCLGCGAKIASGTTISATGSHTWDSGTVTTTATCVSTGVKTYTCTDCGTTKTETIAKNSSNHTGGTETRNAKTATCGTAGYTGDTYCLGCGAKIASGTTISATGSHTWNSGTVTTAATCKTTGVKTYTCTVCKTTKTEAVAKLGHKLTATTAKAATCTTAGNKAYWYCSTCKKYFSDSAATTETTLAAMTIAATGHSWDAGKITTAATCTTAGVKTYTCTACGTTKTEAIAKNSSNHTGGTEIKNAKTADCGTAGYTGDTYCKGCGVKTKTGTTISATGKHTWDSGKITTAATCNAKGIKTFTCTVCSATKTEEIAIDANAHQWSEYTVVKEPTAAAKGLKQRKCKLCGKTESVEISNTNVSLAYNMDDDILSVNFVNAVGMKSWDLEITYDTKVFDKVDTYEEGADARKVGNTKNNSINVSDGINEETAGTILLGGYFKEALWTAEEFLADAKKGKDASVNDTDFEAILFYMLTNEDYDFSEETTITISGSFSMSDNSEITVSDTIVLQHQHNYSNPVIVKAATCKEVGIKKSVCSICGKEMTEEIPKLTTHTWGAWKAVRRPTETERGAISHTCTVCGATEQQVIPTTTTERKVALSYDYAADVLKLNFKDAVGLKYWDLKITYDSDIIAGVDSFEPGADSVKVNNTKNNSVNVLDGINTSVDGIILMGGYFKEKMWTSEEFAADAKTGKDASVNAENFEVLLLNILKENGVLLTQKQSVIRIDGEFSFDSGVVNVSDILIIGCVSPNHSGGTEIRDAKEATYRESGYTGDTYCLGCGAKIASGETIPALVKIGDVDADGTITAGDARLALRASVLLENLDEKQTIAADVDKNGSITAADARLILRASVYLEDPTKW